MPDAQERPPVMCFEPCSLREVYFPARYVDDDYENAIAITSQGALNFPEEVPMRYLEQTGPCEKFANAIAVPDGSRLCSLWSHHPQFEQVAAYGSNT